jgi:hypothetical protein
MLKKEGPSDFVGRPFFVFEGIAFFLYLPARRFCHSPNR